MNLLKSLFGTGRHSHCHPDALRQANGRVFVWRLQPLNCSCASIAFHFTSNLRS
jgi:hypothetical protein